MIIIPRTSYINFSGISSDASIPIEFVNSTGVSNLNVLPALATTTGNKLIICVTNYTVGTPRTVSSISDTGGNTYARCGGVDGGDGTHKFEMWAADVTTGHASNEITITMSGAATFFHIAALQYSGVGSYLSENIAKLDSGTTTDHMSNTITIVPETALIIGWFVTWDFPYAYTDSVSSTIRQLQGDCAAVERIIDSPGSYSVDVTTANMNLQVSICRSFNPI